jgi:putative ABC transport system substrate-binding protein
MEPWRQYGYGASMNRRAALLGWTTLAAALAMPARAQPPKVVRAALFVTFGAAVEPRIRAGALALFAAHGYVQGRNLDLVIVDHADRSSERERLARDLVASRPDVILVMGSPDALLFQRLTRSIPIVFTGIGDPEALGLVESIARPGGNITGASNRYGDLLGKRFELLQALVPGVRRVVVIAATGRNARRLRDSSDQVSARLALAVEHIEMADDSRPSVEGMLAALARARADAVVYAGVRLVGFAPQLLAALEHAGLPAVFSDHEIVSIGGLMSLGEVEDETYRRAIEVAARVLRGQPPATLPVDQLARPHLAINLRTARALKIVFPDSIKLRADQVVE